MLLCKDNANFKINFLSISIITSLIALSGYSEASDELEGLPGANVEVSSTYPDSWYEEMNYPETKGHETTFGWIGDKDAAVAYRDGGFYIRDGLNVKVGFDLYNNKTKMNWYNQDGYLPVMVSEFIKDQATVKIINFANKVTVNGNDYVVAYSRVQVHNPTGNTLYIDPSESPEFTSLTENPYEIAAGNTVNHDFAITIDRFGKGIPRLTQEQIIAAGSWDTNYQQMKAFWDNRLANLVQIDTLPDPTLIDAFKTGYVYTQIIRDGDDLHVGEDGPYDKVFDHDSIGILISLLTAGDFDDAKALMDRLQGVTQYDDAKYKYAWVFALYLQKTGDIEYVRSKFDVIKGFVRKIEEDRTGPNGIMKGTEDIDSWGYWTITNYSALFGLSAYQYLSAQLGDSGEALWASETYNDLYAAVESTLSKNIQDNNLNYIPAGMLQANRDIPRLSEPRDANWASHFMFGRWSWDGYLFGVEQAGVMLSKIDDTYKWGFERLNGILPKHNFGGYPHGWYSSSYNAGYGAAGLRGKYYRSEGIKAYQYMIQNTQSGPFAWWEAIDEPTSDSAWEGIHPVKGGETERSGNSSPHMWGQAVASKVLLNSLVAEKFDGDVIIGRGIPDEWLRAGEEIELSNIPIANNKRFGYHLVAGEQQVTISFSGDQPEGNFLIDLPVFVDGRIVSASAGDIITGEDRVVLPSDTKTVVIKYKANCVTPNIAVNRWFEDQSLLQIDMSEQPSASCNQVFYTTDGTDPTKYGVLYSQPVQLTESAVIKAVVMGNDVVSSDAESTISIKHGQGDGITGYYHQGEHLNDLRFIKPDSNVDFNWGEGSPDQVQIGNDHFSIRWQGELEVPLDGNYYFDVNSDDGVRLYVDGQVILDNWGPKVGSERSETVSLIKGKVPLMLEYLEVGGGANVQLAMGAKIGEIVLNSVTPIPSSLLYRQQQTPVADLSHAGGNAYRFGQATDQRYRYQSFVPEQAGWVDLVEVKVKRSGTPGNMILAIYATDANHKPVGDAFKQVVIQGDNVPAGISLVSATLDVSVENREYAIVLTQEDTSTDGSYEWLVGDIGYASGQFYHGKGDNGWADESFLGDAWLRVYAR